MGHWCFLLLPRVCFSQTQLVWVGLDLGEVLGHGAAGESNRRWRAERWRDYGDGLEPWLMLLRLQKMWVVCILGSLSSWEGSAVERHEGTAVS